MVGLYEVWNISIELFDKNAKKEKTSCSSPGCVGVLTAENISLLMWLYQERKDRLRFLKEKWKSVHLFCGSKEFLRVTMPTPGLCINLFPRHWWHLGIRKNFGCGQLSAVHSLRRRGPTAGCQRREKLYQPLTRSQGSWGQRRQEIARHHPGRELIMVGPERATGADDQVCLGVSTLSSGTKGERPEFLPWSRPNVGTGVQRRPRYDSKGWLLEDGTR